MRMRADKIRHLANLSFAMLLPASDQCCEVNSVCVFIIIFIVCVRQRGLAGLAYSDAVAYHTCKRVFAQRNKYFKIGAERKKI